MHASMSHTYHAPFYAILIVARILTYHFLLSLNHTNIHTYYWKPAIITFKMLLKIWVHINYKPAVHVCVFFRHFLESNSSYFHVWTIWKSYNHNDYALDINCGHLRSLAKIAPAMFNNTSFYTWLIYHDVMCDKFYLWVDSSSIMKHTFELINLHQTKSKANKKGGAQDPRLVRK